LVFSVFITLCDLVGHAGKSAFLDSLSLTLQPRDNLFTLCQGWINCLQAFQAARITGRFVKSVGEKDASSRRDALVEYDRLVRQIANLRTQAGLESQINRRIELNLKIKRLETEKTEATRSMA
jgi:hypothetical protein